MVGLVLKRKGNGYTMNSLVSIAIVLLAMWNFILAKQKRMAERKHRESEEKHHAEKLQLIQNERELARKRMRGLLDHYRGPGNGKA